MSASDRITIYENDSVLVASYGGIIRIRCKGRSMITSSQPAHELPCYCLTIQLYHQRRVLSTGAEDFCKYSQRRIVSWDKDASIRPRSDKCAGADIAPTAVSSQFSRSARSIPVQRGTLKREANISHLQRNR